jgi:dTDP-glucose 4,6-dehydratase
VICHLAALIAIPYSYIAPQSYVDTNITGTLNVLNAARLHDVVRFVHTSTSEVYGTAQFVPITEEHPLAGQSPYSASKIAADQLVHSFFASFGTPVITLRPFNTFGPRQSLRAVIPTIVTQLARGEKQLKLGDLSPTRDFNFVTDTAAGYLAAVNVEGCSGEVVNLGNNFEVSIGEVAEMLIRMFGSSAEIINDSDRARPKNSEVRRLFAANDKALKVLGWNPEYRGCDGFKRGLEKTVEWFSDQRNMKRYISTGYVI